MHCNVITDSGRDIRDVFPRRSEQDVAEDVTESVSRLYMSVLVVQPAHSTEVSHQMLQCTTVVRRQCTDEVVEG